MNFHEYSITIEGNKATVTGDEKKSHQIEMVWNAIADIATQSKLANSQSELQDFVDENKDDKALQMFSVQQQNLNTIIQQIIYENEVGQLSNSILGQLATYSAYQLALFILFKVDGTVIGDGVQYLLDEQRINKDLKLILHCHSCGDEVESVHGVLH